jgi:hypothetical protein
VKKLSHRNVEGG